MKILKAELNERAVDWAKKIIGVDGPAGQLMAVSLVDDDEEFVAVTVFSAYTGFNIDMHIAARPGSPWLSRSYFHAVFELPFVQLRVPRVTGLIRAENFKAQHFVSRLGFIREGRMRKAFPDGGDLMLYGLLREDYLKHPWSSSVVSKGRSVDKVVECVILGTRKEKAAFISSTP